MELNQSRIAFLLGGMVVLFLVAIALGSHLDTLRDAIHYFQINRIIRM